MTTQTDYKFTVDWFSHNIPGLEKALRRLKGKPARALEIGVFEGVSTVWLLENILYHPEAKLTAVDTFEGSPEHQKKHAETLRVLEEIFRANVEASGYGDRVETIRNDSYNALIRLNMNRQDYYDMVYVDASHTSWDVMADAVLSWPLLKKGGILVFDDYLWDGFKEAHKCPKLAVDAFLNCYVDQLKVIHADYQVIVKKR